MKKRQVDDYLMNGIHGIRRPKEDERLKYLGTLRERIVIALTVGEVMTGKGYEALNDAMNQHHEGTTLLINGEMASRFYADERALAHHHKIPYSVVRNKDAETEIGLVLTYKHAVHVSNIFLDSPQEQLPINKYPVQKEISILKRLIQFFK